MTRPIHWGTVLDKKDIEWADDLTTFAESVEECVKDCEVLEDLLTSLDKTQVRTFGRLRVASLQFGRHLCKKNTCGN